MGPTVDMLNLCKKYRLLNVVLDCMQLGEYISLGEWKRFVNDVTITYDIKRWKCTSYMYKSLSLFTKDIDMFQISPWWVHCFRNIREVKNVKNIIQLLLGKGRADRELCKLCMYGMKDTVHILFECHTISAIRSQLWNDLTEVCEPAFIKDLNKMSNEEKCCFIFNAFNVAYTPEWEKMYTAMLVFINVMFKKFEEEYKL